MTERLVIILQGVPGSGKSTLATNLQGIGALNAMVVSADEFFIGDDNVYRFDPRKIGKAHEHCQKMARCVLDYTPNNLIVDNTNIHAWEARPYQDMADERGIKVIYIRCVGAFTNVHGVPTDKVERMRLEMETLTPEVVRRAKR